MKNYFWVLILATGLLSAACDEPVQEPMQVAAPAVDFDLAVAADAAAQTRGAELTTANLQDFLVFAAYGGSADFSPTQSRPDFMYRQAVYRRAEGWSYSPLKYWPNATSKVSFFAYAPVDTQGACLFSSNAATGIPSLTYTVPTAVADQPDLLAAAPLYNLTSQATPIRFSFSHLLCNIGFSAQLAAASPVGSSLYVDRIELSGLYDRGSYATNWTVDDSHTADYELTAAGATLAATALSLTAAALTTESGAMLLLPQQVAVTALLTVDLRLVEGTSTTLYTVRKLLRELLPTMQSGKKYRILLTAGVGEVSMSYTVVPWNVKRVDLPPFD